MMSLMIFKFLIQNFSAKKNTINLLHNKPITILLTINKNLMKNSEINKMKLISVNYLHLSLKKLHCKTLPKLQILQ